jgi:hypothetical protein
MSERFINCDLIKNCCEKPDFRRYSDQYKLAYYETPKCASTSIKKILHDSLPDYTRTTNNSLDNYFKFTIVRNPWERFVSIYKMITTNKHRVRRVLKPMWGKTTLTFEEFVNDFDKPGKRNHHRSLLTDYFPKDRKLDLVIKFEKLEEGL